MVLDPRQPRTPTADSARAWLVAQHVEVLNRAPPVSTLKMHAIKALFESPKGAEAHQAAFQACRPQPVPLQSVFELIRAADPALVSTLNKEQPFPVVLRALRAEGRLLWFDNIPALADLVFLDPNWLYHNVVGPALAPATFSVSLHEPHPGGRVRLAELQLVLKAAGIDASIGVEVLQALNLCIKLPRLPQEDSNYVFIPSFLSENEPSGVLSAAPNHSVAGRRLVVQDATLGLWEGVFETVQVQVLERFYRADSGSALVARWAEAVGGRRDVRGKTAELAAAAI
jgi:hypothetical protein